MDITEFMFGSNSNAFLEFNPTYEYISNANFSFELLFINLIN